MEHQMGDKLEIIGETGLQFFGKMTASISHEMKNVLAIINENAGLLEDFTLMAERGMAIETERLKRLSQAVIKQISRADVIIKNMNRFAHSADESLKTADLNETLELVVFLSNRFASMRRVALESKPQESPVKIKTYPFFLMNLLWLCLDFAMDASGGAKMIELVAQKIETGAQIRFRGLNGLASASMGRFQDERAKRLLGLLRAELAVSLESKEIVVKLGEHEEPIRSAKDSDIKSSPRSVVKDG
jgi:C4-dicarboxylate-specific signal transduction histidine kinase